MKIKANWEGKKRIKVENEAGHQVQMDEEVDKGGDRSAMTPAELLTASLAGCMGISIMTSLLNYKESVEELSLDLDFVKSDKPPNRVEEIKMLINIKTEIPKDRIDRIVKLSHEKYCTVSNTLNAETSYEINYL